jgi:hypothetical protein
VNERIPEDRIPDTEYRIPNEPDRIRYPVSGIRLWRIVQVVAVALVVWFLYRYIARHWDEIRTADSAISLHWHSLVAAAGIILFTYALLIGAWRAVLVGWGDHLSYRTAARIWCLSNLGKYIPGKIWQITGMAAMAQQAGVRPWAAAGSAIVVQLLNIATGTLITAIFAPNFGQPVLIAVAGLATALGAAALASPAGTAWASRTLARLTGRNIELRAVAPSALLISAAITAAAWVLYGWALYFAVRGLTGRDIAVGEAIGMFTGAYVAGLINIFTPAGVGTRENILLTWLTVPYGAAAATVITIGSRLLMTATELIAALVVIPIMKDYDRKV